MNRHQKRSQKANLRRIERQGKKGGKEKNPIQVLNDRLDRLEGLLGENFGSTFRNIQQLKHGLDATEVNQRALVKVVQDLAKGLSTIWPASMTDPKALEAEQAVVEQLQGKFPNLIKPEELKFPLPVLQNQIDWGKYYRAAEDDIEADRLDAYKHIVADFSKQADDIEAAMEGFEKDLQAELDKDPDHAAERKEAVDRFLSDLKREIAKVRAASQLIEEGGLTKEKVEKFNERIFKDTLFMISRNKAQKAAATEKEENKVVAASSMEDATTVTEFGG